jgi:hypothetical protein
MPPDNEQRPLSGAPSAGLDQSLNLEAEDTRQVEPLVGLWAARIRPHLVQAVEGIVAAGRELIAAKAELPHGGFGPLLAELELSRTTAQRFMRVAQHPAIANAARVPHLPAAIGTLDVLARLDEDELTGVIEAGEIGPETTRPEAQAVVRRLRPLARLTQAEREAALRARGVQVRISDPATDDLAGAASLIARAIR